MGSKAEDKLLELGKQLKQFEPSQDTDEKPQQETPTTPQKRTTTIEDVSDLTTKTPTHKPLSNLDYLILTGLGDGLSKDRVAEEYDVSRNYINKLARTPEGSSFLTELTDKKKQTAIEQSTSAVAEGVDVFVRYVDELKEKGYTEEYLKKMFGKMSLLEVQSMLSKQEADEEQDGNELNMFFNSILAKNN